MFFTTINVHDYFNKIAWWQVLIHLIVSLIIILWWENSIFFVFLMQVCNQDKDTTSEKEMWKKE